MVLGISVVVNEKLSGSYKWDFTSDRRWNKYRTVTVDFSNTSDYSADGREDFYITESGTYVLFGELSGGVVVDVGFSEGKCRLIMNGVSIKNEGEPALLLKSADDVEILLYPGSENKIESKNIAEKSSALLSLVDLVISGDGNLSIISDGVGINAMDDLTILTKNIVIEAASNKIEEKKPHEVEVPRPTERAKILREVKE